MSEVRRLFLLCLLAGLTTNCGSDYGLIESKSAPDQSIAAEVRLYGPYFLADQRLKIQLRSKSVTKVIFRDDGTDIYPCFAEIAWSPDSQLVGVLVNNCYGTTVRMAYDRAKRQSVSADLTDELLRAALVKDYNFKPGEFGDPNPSQMKFISDPLLWAETHAAVIAFQAKHQSLTQSAERR
jgi:hypothetical protein